MIVDRTFDSQPTKNSCLENEKMAADSEYMVVQ